jgi:hypothetical protein
MTATKTLNRAILKLPLAEREALLAVVENSISDEYDRLAAASLAADIRMIERTLAKYPLSHEQVNSLELRVDAAERGDAHCTPWEQVQQEIFAELRRSH